ncbi:hypothetical protein RF037_04435, partial [Serratia marcescens]|uniref:hypothetical protein n=1 Tax=Serratia marcescens TaxID=615 RepID=UPI0028130C82
VGEGIHLAYDAPLSVRYLDSIGMAMQRLHINELRIIDRKRLQSIAGTDNVTRCFMTTGASGK